LVIMSHSTLTNNNKAFSLAAGDFVMMLNDDTIVQSGAFQHMLKFVISNPEVGAVGAYLLNPDGSKQQSWDIPPNPLDDGLRPLSTFFRYRKKRNRSPIEVGSVGGACMMVRRETVEQVGMLDTDFDPIYSEEVDYCHRIRRAGWSIFHIPQAKVIHFGSQTMDRAPLNKIERLYEKKALFYKKHHGLVGLWAYKFSLWFFTVIKLLGWIFMFPINYENGRMKIRSHFHIAKKALFF